MKRGEIWWAALPSPIGRRPVLVIQSNRFNESSIRSVVVALITSNLALEAAPGNVRLARGTAGVPKACVVNVSQVYAVERRRLTERAGVLDASLQHRVDAGLRLVLELPAGADRPGVMEAAGEYLARAHGAAPPVRGRRQRTGERRKPRHPRGA
jgi:mRNA interferase MazF